MADTDSPDDRIGRFGQIILWQLEGWSTAKIARELGVARSTLYLWRDDPVFRALEEEGYRQARSAAVSDMRAAVVEAVRTVREIMRGRFLDPKVSRVRLAAAKLVLEHTGLIKRELDSPLDALGDEQLDELAGRLGYRRVDAEEAKH